MEFIQELHDSSSGYGYIYHKKVSLVAGKPEMLIEHSLKNVGTRAIHTSVYDHNFLVLDKQPTGTGFTITVPFAIHSDQPPEKDFAEIRKNQIVYLKTLAGQDVVATPIEGFGHSSDDYKVRIENGNVKAGMTTQRGSATGKDGALVHSHRACGRAVRRCICRARWPDQLEIRLRVLHAPARKRQITGPGSQSQPCLLDEVGLIVPQDTEEVRVPTGTLTTAGT